MIYEKTNYSAGLNYLNNTFIREYDISKANINVLFSKGIIDKKTYDYLYESERMIRQIFVGKLIKNNKGVSDVLKQGILEARKNLFEANDIKDYEVLSIKNDAVFIIGRVLSNTDFGLIKFANKNQYTAFMSFMNMELYYYYNRMTEEEKLDIKGISDDKLINHEKYMLQFIKDVFYLMQTSSPINALQMVKDFYMDYINFNLPAEYYRMFNISSLYHYKSSPFMNTGFESDMIVEENKKSLDITYNLEILKNIQKILVTIALQ